MPDGPPRGGIVWHELLTTEPEAAIAFYRQVIGWGSLVFAADPPYRVWTMQDVPMGGLTRMPAGAEAPPSWLLYVAVPDVDRTVEQAGRLGARTFVRGTDIPNVGRFAVLGDPQGATFAVYKPSMPGTGSDDAVVGDFSWHELATSDWKAAWEFYHALFGWEHASSFDMGEAGTYWMFRRGGGDRMLGGMFNRADADPAHWLCFVRVPDADRAAALASRYGGTVVSEPMDVPGGDRIATLADPQGAAFAVHALAAKAKAVPRPRKKAATAGKAKRTPAKRKSAKRAAPKRQPSAKRRLSKKRVGPKTVRKKK